MEPIDRAMLLIKSLDGHAHLEFSEYTRQWYVEARIEVSDGACLHGGTEHEATPEKAVLAFLDRLQTVPIEQIVVTNGPAGRRHWRWNGAGFAEEPVEWFTGRVRTGEGAGAGASRERSDPSPSGPGSLAPHDTGGV